MRDDESRGPRTERKTGRGTPGGYDDRHKGTWPLRCLLSLGQAYDGHTVTTRGVWEYRVYLRTQPRERSHYRRGLLTEYDKHKEGSLRALSLSLSFRLPGSSRKVRSREVSRDRIPTRWERSPCWGPGSRHSDSVINVSRLDVSRPDVTPVKEGFTLHPYRP